MAIREKIRRLKDLFKIKTEHATLGVAGTKFYVSEDGELVVKVIEDAVRLTPPAGADWDAVILEEGFQVIIRAGEEPIKTGLEGDPRLTLSDFQALESVHKKKGKAIPQYSVPPREFKARLYF